MDDVEYPTGIKFALILMAAFLSLVLVGLVGHRNSDLYSPINTEMLILRQDFSILSTAVPAITTHFKTIADIGWYYSA